MEKDCPLDLDVLTCPHLALGRASPPSSDNNVRPYRAGETLLWELNSRLCHLAPGKAGALIHCVTCSRRACGGR